MSQIAWIKIVNMIVWFVVLSIGKAQYYLQVMVYAT